MKVDMYKKEAYYNKMAIKSMILSICLAITPVIATAKTITVAVIDTGFGFENRGLEAKLCKYGHKDFTDEKKYLKRTNTVTKVPQDFNGHGTNIVGGIEKYAKNVNYCLIILKYYKDNTNGSQNMKRSNDAFKYAVNLKADVINYSGGGIAYDSKEHFFVNRFLNNGGILVVAAGNNGSDLDNRGTFYPALYDKRAIVVGNGKNIKEHDPSSNYGKAVDRWEIGLVDTYGIKLFGTSQSTAIVTGKILNERFSKSNKSNSVR